MNILYIASRLPVPPITKGDTLRDYHTIKGLAKRGHKVTLISYYRGQEDQSPGMENLNRYCAKIILVEFHKLTHAAQLVNGLYNPKPFQVLLYNSRRLKKTIRKTLEDGQYDAAYVHFARLGEYLKKYNLPKIIDLQDLFSKNMYARFKKEKNPAIKLVALIESWKMKWYENSITDYYNYATVVSERDVPRNNHNIVIVPLGVEPRHLDRSKQDESSIIFFGNMNYFPNEEAAIFLIKDIMPHVWRQLPNTKVFILGNEPSKALLQLRNENVEVTGFVKSLNPYLEKATIAVAPLKHATGTQIKLLDAMSAGIPQITTDIAAAGLKELTGQEMLIMPVNAQVIADSILELLRDEKKRKLLAQNAQQYVQNYYSWGKSTDILEILLLDIITNKPGTSATRDQALEQPEQVQDHQEVQEVNTSL